MTESERFSYASVEDTLAIVKGGDKAPEWKKEMVKTRLVQISARLSAWYPNLKSRWLEADPEDPIVDFVRTMVEEAAKKYVDNPEGMSSETMGPYAYSRFDSQDVYKTLFNERDLKALEALLEEDNAVRRSVVTNYVNAFPAAPQPAPGRYSNSRRRYPYGGMRGGRGCVW